jgi:AcrR family transcriptional regulator
VAEALSRLEWVRPPQQARSRETLVRILDAAETLLATRSFDEVSVSDVVRHAASSVGSFYSRFPDKEALLHALQERFVAEASATVDAALAPERWEGASLAQILAECSALLVRAYRLRQGLHRTLLARAAHDPSLRQRGARVRGQLAERLRVILLARRSETTHPDPERAAEFLLEIALSVVERRALTSGAPVANLAFDDEQVVAELARALIGYVGAR